MRAWSNFLTSSSNRNAVPSAQTSGQFWDSHDSEVPDTGKWVPHCEIQTPETSALLLLSATAAKQPQFGLENHLWAHRNQCGRTSLLERHLLIHKFSFSKMGCTSFSGSAGTELLHPQAAETLVCKTWSLRSIWFPQKGRSIFLQHKGAELVFICFKSIQLFRWIEHRMHKEANPFFNVFFFFLISSGRCH